MIGGDVPLNSLSGRKGYQPLDRDDRNTLRAMPSSRAPGPSSSSRPRSRKRNSKNSDDVEAREHLLGGETSADDADLGGRLDEDVFPQSQQGSEHQIQAKSRPSTKATGKDKSRTIPFLPSGNGLRPFLDVDVLSNLIEKLQTRFPPNVVRNQKYNIATFLPLVFYEQFKFFFNLYFLLVALSQFVPALKIGRWILRASVLWKLNAGFHRVHRHIRRTPSLCAHRHNGEGGI